LTSEKRHFFDFCKSPIFRKFTKKNEASRMKLSASEERSRMQDLAPFILAAIM
jgi:hypothetical protein